MIGANADARSFLLQELPALVELLNERSLSTDESELGAPVTSAECKPTPMTALGKLRAVDRIAALKTSSGLRIHLRSSRQSHYTHQRAAAGDKSWNNATLLLDAKAAAAQQAHKRSKAIRSLRTMTIRAYHKVWEAHCTFSYISTHASAE